MCGGYALKNFDTVLDSIKAILPNTQKKLVLITNNANMTAYSNYHENNVEISVKLDNELSIIPLNKVHELIKYLDESEYSIFINPNAKFVGFDAELLEDGKLHFGYINQEEDNNSQEHFGFGSLIYGSTELFNQLILFAHSYQFVEDENHTDEQAFIRFIENNPSITDYRESSDIILYI